MFILSYKWMNKLFSDENKLKRRQGPPHIYKVKQYEFVLFLEVSLFLEIVWFIKKNISIKILLYK